MSKTSYNEAINELDELIESMTSNEVDIDTVVNDVSRAKDLIKLCQSKLFDVNSKVNEIVDSMGSNNKNEQAKASSEPSVNAEPTNVVEFPSDDSDDNESLF
jgi:exodeoxyribonuclease VII small subunit